MAMKADEIARDLWKYKSKQYNPRAIDVKLYRKYEGFESAYRDYNEYIHLNEKLRLEKKSGGKIPLSEKHSKYEAYK